MTDVNECIFCEIVAGRQPPYRVLEDEHTVAFLDLRPASPGHALVVPRAHGRDLWQMSEAAHGQVAAMVHRVAGLLHATLAPERASAGRLEEVLERISARHQGP